MRFERVWRAACAAAVAGAIGFAARGALAGAAPAGGSALEKATFAMGCFWCAETAFEGLPGVVSVTSGYTGGPEKNPTYEQVSSHETGHYEAVQILFDPEKISYSKLLDLFWRNVDPTDGGGQFCDRGHQYRAAIFYESESQKKLGEESKRKLETTRQRFDGKIVTEIRAAQIFWPAEDYHQDFYLKNPDRYHSYRQGCGRDRRLRDLWGAPGRQGHARS